MSMRRFVAPTARDCLRRVKDELGPDAVVVSNKPVEGGVEIMAMTSESFELLSRQGPSRESVSAPQSSLSSRSASQRRTVEPARTAPALNPTPTMSAPHHASAAVIQAARQAYASGQILDTSSASERAKAAMPRVQPQARPVTDADEDYRVHLSGQVRKAVSAPASSLATAHGKTHPHPDATAHAHESSRLRPLPGRGSANPDHAHGNEHGPAAGLRDVAHGDRTTRSHASSASTVSPLHMDKAKAKAQDMGKAKAAPPQDEAMQTQVHQLMGEMQTIKVLLERQLAGFAWGEISRESPVRAQLLAEMLDSGFSGQLARKLCQELPVEMNVEDAHKWMKTTLNRHLRTLSSENDIVDRGGIYALVGPTGVGKTTTTAKLAARCVVRYGPDKIALLTTDGYRIGAHEQLRIYGRILGVPVHVVRDGDDLRHTLADLRDKHMVLIDTVGMSQRDRMVAEQAAMLAHAGEVNRLLLLNATSRGDTLDDVVSAYSGDDLSGVILSKVDETASIAPALDVVIRHGLLLCYVANGQRVPEDMHLPNRNYLLHRAFKQSEDASPHRLQKEETGFGLVMATANDIRKVSGGVRG